MKAFSFRLEQVRRWRETQAQLQKSKLAAASARLAEIRASIETRKAGLAGAATRVREAETGADLIAYAGFRNRESARIRDLEAQALIAQRTVALEMGRLIEADRKLKLLENLKADARAEWQHEFDRELSAFADEAFLNRIQR